MSDTIPEYLPGAITDAQFECIKQDSPPGQGALLYDTLYYAPKYCPDQRLEQEIRSDNARLQRELTAERARGERLAAALREIGRLPDDLIWDKQNDWRKSLDVAKEIAAAALDSADDGGGA